MRAHDRRGSQAFDLGQFDEAIAEYGSRNEMSHSA
jgi:hypothetical protein